MSKEVGKFQYGFFQLAKEVMGCINEVIKSSDINTDLYFTVNSLISRGCWRPELTDRVVNIASSSDMG